MSGLLVGRDTKPVEDPVGQAGRRQPRRPDRKFLQIEGEADGEWDIPQSPDPLKPGGRGGSRWVQDAS